MLTKSRNPEVIMEAVWQACDKQLPEYCVLRKKKPRYFWIVIPAWKLTGAHIHYEFIYRRGVISAEFHVESSKDLNEMIQHLAQRIAEIDGLDVKFSDTWGNGCMFGVTFATDVPAAQMVTTMRLLIEKSYPEINAWFENGMQQGALPVADTTITDGENAMTLNTILYGPPGTGKTYETIHAALQILDPAAAADYKQVDDNKSASLEQRLAARTALKARFDQLSEEQRVRFVTFHQSFSYEDFVEGLRAETDETTGQIRYEVVDGVFKSLCESASVKVTRHEAAPVDVSGRRIWKMSLGNTQGSDAGIFDECLQGGYVLLGYGGRIDFSGCLSRDDMLQRYEKAGQSISSNTDYNLTSVTTFITRMKVGDLVVVSDGNFKFRAIGEITGDYVYKPHPDYDDGYAQMRSVKWLRQYSPSLPRTALLNGQFSQMTLYELKEPTLAREKLQSLLADKPAEQAAQATEARVLIIDEINRGNISRIFGELITLIEPSKRAGADEALLVTLPYSKEPFSVPGNVYLIGTMNTADRSLAGLDLALRRRFAFTEMSPKPELLDGVAVDGINIGQMLRVMNQRITVLLDRDHTIGHAYFMPLQTEPTLAGLADIFRQKILPLLQEYFFEDWERIRWVLNDQSKPQDLAFIVKDTSLDLSGLFAGVQDKLRQSPQWMVNDKAFKSAAAFSGIAANLGKAATGQPRHEEAEFEA